MENTAQCINYNNTKVEIIMSNKGRMMPWIFRYSVNIHLVTYPRFCFKTIVNKRSVPAVMELIF